MISHLKEIRMTGGTQLLCTDGPAGHSFLQVKITYSPTIIYSFHHPSPMGGSTRRLHFSFMLIDGSRRV